MSNDNGGTPNQGPQPPAHPGGPVPPQPASPTAAPRPAVPPVPAYPPATPQRPAYQPPLLPGTAPQQPVAPNYPGAIPPAAGYPGTAPAAPGYAAPGYPAPAYTQPYGQPYPAPVKSNGLAIASLICGIAAVVFCWAYLILPLLAGIPAVITGHLALKKVRSEPTLGGKGLAIAGLITGYVGIGLGVLIGAFIILAIVAAVAYSAS